MRGFSQLEARQRLGVQRVRPFVVPQLRPNLMSLSHSAVRLSLPCAEKLPRRRDWKNVSQALESASPAIAPARPLLPHHLAFRPCRRDRTRSLTGAPFFQAPSSQDVMVEINFRCSMAHLRNTMREISTNGGPRDRLQRVCGDPQSFVSLF